MKVLRGKISKPSNLITCLALLIVSVSGFLLLKGCGISGDTDSSPSSSGAQALAWSGTTPAGALDTGSGLVSTPEIAVEPDGDGTAMAVWLEERDADPFDDLPPIIHLYARRATSGDDFDTTDTGICPGGDDRLENNDNDGICLVDVDNGPYSAASPKIAMDNNGDAIVVWQQSDGADCTASADPEPCTRIYARSFSGGQWNDCIPTTDCIISRSGDLPAAHPDIAVEPDGGGSAIAVFDQWSGTIWRIRANRLTGGLGTDNWGQSGTADIGSGSEPQGSPRIGMDSTGQAVAAWIRHDLQANDCVRSTSNTLANAIATDCTDSVLDARKFDGVSSWTVDGTGVLNLDPGTSSVAASSTVRIVCFENSTDGTQGDSTDSDACVSVQEFDLAVNDDLAVLLIKTSWGFAEDWQGACGSGFRTHHDTHFDGLGCRPDGSSYKDYRGQAIVARVYGMGNTWNTTNWPSTIVANFGTSPTVGTNSGGDQQNFWGTGPFPSGGCADAFKIDGGRDVIDCDIFSPRVAVSNLGTGRALAVYETYNGSSYDIQAHRYNGSTWTLTTLDGGGESHAPRIAMDATTGNGAAVWVQDISSSWRIRSREFTDPSTWAAAVTIDGSIGSESDYFNPEVEMNELGTAFSLFIGWKETNNDASTRIYAVTGP